MKNSNTNYDSCGDRVWYNHQTQSIIYGPNNMQQAVVDPFFNEPYVKIKDYAMNVVHNPNDRQRNLTFFNIEPVFDHFYIAKNNNKLAYSFKQEEITDIRVSYAGWYFSNIQLTDMCNLFKAYDNKAFCENQPTNNEFNLITSKVPGPLAGRSLIDIWAELTGPIRVEE